MKKELKTKLTQERIIEAALIEFSQKGYKAFGINELCKNHKISKGILYHNFSGKTEIYLACVRESFQKAVSIIRGESGDIPSLADYMERRHRFSKDFPHHSHVFFEAWMTAPAEIAEEVAKEMDILWNAKDYVYIFTPYLIIDHEMTLALTMAAKRGVDVRIVVPKIPDKKAVYTLTESYFRPLLEAGVRLYRYTPGFIHAKSYLADDKVGVVGTINMDYRSLYLHFECGTFLYEVDALKDLKQDYLETFAVSEEVQLKELGEGLLKRTGQAVLRVLSPLF